jgi:glutaredoxin 2
MLTLTHYNHCPYCIRVRMALGIKHIAHQLRVLANDDEATPMAMVGKKVVPILTKEDGSHMAESLDIVAYLDEHYGNTRVFVAPKDTQASAAIQQWIEQSRSYLSRLTYPRFVQSASGEFATPSARAYFIHKKEQTIGSFAQHLENTPQLLAQAEQHLESLVPLIHSPESVHGTLSLDDILLFPVLHSMTIIGGLRLPDVVDAYVRTMAARCDIALLEA